MNKVLMWEVTQNRNKQGLSERIVCKEDEETISHLVNLLCLFKTCMG